MRILELCCSPGVGGLELYVDKSSRWLTRLGHQCINVVGGENFLAGRLRQSGFEPIDLQRRSRRLPLREARRLARIIDEQDIDIVHMHWGDDLLLAVLGKRWARRPVRLVYTRQMALTRAKKDFYHRFLYRHVDRFLSITEKLRQQAVAFLPMPAEHIQLLYYGVPAPQLSDTASRRSLRAEMGTDDDNIFLIGSVARIEEQKGQHLIVEAVRRLREDGLPVEAQIIGPAMDAAYLEGLRRKVAALGLAQAIRFPGPHPNPQGVMPAFDVLALTTRMETFGLVLAEAMRAGVAVIGTDAGGVPEIIEDGQSGLLFPPEDGGALASQLKRLIDDTALRARLAAAGKTRADELFSEEAHYGRLAALFGELTAGLGDE